MIYKNFRGLALPMLGVGAMRLPLRDEHDAHIDEEETARMVDLAMQQGANYFDTAYGYHSGQSEVVLGKVLKRYPRESYYLADKFPGYDLSNMDKVESIFSEQLARCGVDYFDFYLFHNVYEKNIDPYLDEKTYGILPYLLEQKAAGRIRHLGFSCHGSLQVLERFLDAYGEHMEFCQIQLNYLDWRLQDAQAKLELLNRRGIPVWVMEPLRGGRLAKLTEEEEAKLKALRPEESGVAWAFRFLQSLPGVAVVLSGMSTLAQLQDNIAIFQKDTPLSQKEFTAVTELAREMMGKGILSCTACRYCVDHCAQELNIPYLLSLYNEHKFTGGGFLAPMAVDALPQDKRPAACVACKSCEEVCPQQLKISDALAEFTKMLDPKA